jgi:flap endonuclease-1
MGILGLNKLLREKAPKSITLVKLADLSGSKIAMDLSILIYALKNITLDKPGTSLKEQFELFEASARKNALMIVYVADGKSGDEKSAEIDRRREERAVLFNQIAATQAALDCVETVDAEKRAELEAAMVILKKKTIFVNSDEKRLVIDTLHAMDCMLLTAYGEADDLLASLIHGGHVDYVMSRDTDMIAHGCAQVLREIPDSDANYFDRTFENVTYLRVLTGLDLTQPEFIDLCILLGCDYYRANVNCKHDGRWMAAVYKAIRRQRTVDKIATTSEFVRTFNFTYSNADADIVAGLRVRFGEVGPPEQYTNDWRTT